MKHNYNGSSFEDFSKFEKHIQDDDIPSPECENVRPDNRLISPEYV